MKILIACEESQAICKAFRERGHEAYSCDIQECSGGHPEWHIKGDCLPLLNGKCSFITQDGEQIRIDTAWDLLIAHPPCTYLSTAGNRWFNVEKYGEKALKRLRDREEALDFFMKFVNAECDKIAIENPVGIISTRYRKPDQIIQPYQFGHYAKKATCLWLKGLPKLKPTNIVDIKEKRDWDMWDAQRMKDENGKFIPFNDPRLPKLRSKTFQGIAKAIAEQWEDK